MARAGIYKSEVKKARDALLAQGRNPSIDAVRAELGNTGSKTTIHRYLRELEEEEGAGFGRGVATSEAIQDLVGRLAERLHEEAGARLVEQQSTAAQQLAQRDETIAALQLELTDFSSQLQRTEVALRTEQAAHEQTRQAQQNMTLHNVQLEQQLTDLRVRLAENETHRQSLEDKHLHARETLDHYRASVKDQRDQEQRRHEQQLQQLQTELRTANQTLIVKQNELTHAYQDSARMGAELVATRKELHRCEREAEVNGKAREALQARVIELETHAAALDERLKQLSASREELWQLLHGMSAAVTAEKDGDSGMSEPLTGGAAIAPESNV
ncbi:DNA-binding protein [Chromobacterium haemolyticum]|uniref:DNA-binding protein n=1 Tax=Chromobacterium haemolyticum TaxID=394935 RepID=UPI000694CE2D|nr:DNA-binding protein [Chromobacterium haemolyticum]